MSQYDNSYIKPHSVGDQDASKSGLNSLSDIFGGPSVVAYAFRSAIFSDGNVGSPLVSAGQTLTATSSQVKPVLSSNVSSTPSWVSTLATSSIARDMSAAIVNGQVTYSGLQTLLTDVASTLSSSNTTLSAAQFSDLAKIANNLNNGVTTSAYLTGIMDSLVLGSRANATWTGGGASATSLGNLAVGSSATKLSELIGTWFLGTNLPNSQVIENGSRFSVSYSNVSGPLFGAGGPSMNDINQGQLGDCYLLAGLAEVAYQNPTAITSMITDNGNNTYGVRFFINGAANYVTVNASFANGQCIFNSGTNIWASLVEKAYAQLQTSGAVTGNTAANYGNAWSTIGNGGNPAYTLEEITGAPTITQFQSTGSAWTNVTYSSSLSSTAAPGGASLAAVQSALIADLAAGDDVVLSSFTNAKDSLGRTTLVANHAMSIYGYDAATQMFEIRNPWGTAARQSWDTTFEVSLSTLLAARDAITIANVGPTATPLASAQASVATAASALSHAMAGLSVAPPASAMLNLTHSMQPEHPALFAAKA